MPTLILAAACTLTEVLREKPARAALFVACIVGGRERLLLG